MGECERSASLGRTVHDIHAHRMGAAHRRHAGRSELADTRGMIAHQPQKLARAVGDANESRGNRVNPVVDTGRSSDERRDGVTAFHRWSCRCAPTDVDNWTADEISAGAYV